MRDWLPVVAVVATTVGAYFTLSGQIGGVEDRLTTRIDRLEDRMDQRFLLLDEQNKDILQRLTVVETLQRTGAEQ